MPQSRRFHPADFQRQAGERQQRKRLPTPHYQFQCAFTCELQQRLTRPPYRIHHWLLCSWMFSGRLTGLLFLGRRWRWWWRPRETVLGVPRVKDLEREFGKIRLRTNRDQFQFEMLADFHYRLLNFFPSGLLDALTSPHW